MSISNPQQLGDAIQGRLQGDRLALNEQAILALEIPDVRGLLPSGSLELSGVAIEVTDAAVRLSGRSATPCPLPGLADIAIKELVLSLRFVVAAGTIQVTASLAGVLSTPAGAWAMTASAEGLSLWRVAVATDTITLGDVVASLPGAAIDPCLPGSLRAAAKATRLSMCAFSFSPDSSAQSRVDVALSNASTWELLSGRVAVGDTRLRVSIAVEPGGALSVFGDVAGTVTVGGASCKLSASLAPEALSGAIEAVPGSPPFGLADAGALLGVSDALTPAQDALTQLGVQGLRPSRIALEVGLADGAVRRADVTLQFVLRDLTIEGRLEYPGFKLVGGLAQGSPLDLRRALGAVAPDAADILAVMPALSLSQLELAVQPREKIVEFSAASAAPWDILPGRLVVRDSTLRFTAFPTARGGLGVEGSLAGTTVVAGGAFSVKVTLLEGAMLSVQLEPSPDNQPIGVSTLGGLLGAEEALAPVSDALGQLGFTGVRPGRLALGVDLSAPKVSEFEIAVGLALRGVALEGYLQYPDLQIGGGLVRDTQIDLRALVQQLGVDASNLPALAITELAFAAAPERKELTLDARVAGDWQLAVGKTSVALTAVELGFSAANGGTTAKIDAWAELGGAEWIASVELPGLELSLGLAPGASLALKELVIALLPGDLTLPPAAPALVFSQLELKAQPRAQTFTFHAETADMWTLPFGQGLALGKIKLALAASKDGEQIAPSGSLAGTLALGGGELTGALKLEQGGGNLSLVQGEAPIGLTDVIAGFVPGGVALPAELDGLGRLQLRGLSGSVDFASQKYSFKGEASLVGLTLGALSVPRATGSLEIAGNGSTLERLSIKFAASINQDLVPALQVDAIAFELELAHAAGGGWTWHVGGSLVAGLFELPKQTLRADASNGELRFSVKSDPPLTWSLPGAPEVLSLSFTSLALTLRRDEAARQTAWSFECTSGLQLAGLPRVSGTLGLYVEQDRRGFAFTADKDQGALDLRLPLVAGDDRTTIGCKLKAERLSLLKTTEWTLSAESSLTWVVPRPSAADSTDPVDKALALLGKVFADKTTATLAATTSGVTLTVAALPQVPVPVPVLVGQQLVWDRMGSIGLTRIELRLGKTVSASGKIRLGLPEELSNIFGEENGKPKTRVFASEWVLGLSVDEKAGLSLQIESLPINLEASNYFKKETEGGRTWSRFTLGDVCSFRYASFEDEPGQTWVHVDLFDMGEVRFQQPSFGFNGADFSARLNFDVLRDLRVPTAPLRWLLSRGNMKDLADKLPTHLALLDVHVLDPATKEFDADRFVSTLQQLAAAMRIELAGVEELRSIARAMAGAFNQLPQDLRSYLDVTIPRRLDLSIAVTPATGLGVKFDISAPKEPLRCLIPTPAGVYGLTLRKLSLGEILSGSLLLFAADLDCDFFDMPALVASLALPPAVSAQLTDTKSIQRKFIVKELMCLVVYQTAVPIPIPIWFDELGFKHHGLEGVRGQLVLGNNLAGISMGKLLKGLCDLYRELRRFFTDAGYALPADLFQRNGINLGVHVKPGFVQLPKYLGAALLGSEQDLLNLGVDQLLVPVANFLKQPDIDKLLAVIPLQLRHGSFGTETPLRIGPLEPQAAWLLSSLREFDGLVARRGEQRNAFVDSLYSGGAAAGDASVRLLRETVLAARNRGLLTQFRLKGEIGSLVGIDMGGRVAVTKRPASGDRPATAELSAAGNLELRVLGCSALNAGFSLQDGELAFAGGFSLFPSDSAYKVKGDVSGKIGRDRMRVDGQVELALAPLPAARAGLSLSYEQVALHVSWLDHDWTLSLARKYADQVLFSARADRPVAVLPGLVTLLDANDDTRGPSLELVGPRDASLALSGRVRIPALRMTGRGSLSVSPGRVVGAAAGQLCGLSTSLALRGESLDRPASFNFSAEFKGDLFAQITEQLHAGFSSLVAGARQLANEAERVFGEEWAKFRALVERGANEIRAGILETKRRIEWLIGELEKAVDNVISALHVKDDEIAARKAFLEALRQGAQKGLQWFEDRARELRASLEAKRQELVDHDAWYDRLNGFERFLNWGYYAARLLDLLIATEALPGMLRFAEQELAKAREGVPIIADKADAMLQQLDRMRNGFADELSRHKQAIVDRRRELDHYNELLLNNADELIRRFGQAVDGTVMKAAKKTFELARTALGDLEAASENFRNLGRPFDVERLTIQGSLGTQAGAKFEARADIVVNTFSPRKVVQDLGFSLDLDDLAGTAADLAKDLWDRRESLKAIDYDEYQRAKAAQEIAANAQKIEQEYKAVVAQRAQLGPEFGETLDKKLLLDMKWTELAEFHHYLQKAEVRSPVLADAAALTGVFQGVLERYREAAEASRISRHALSLLQRANPGLQFDFIDPAAMLEGKMDLVLQMIQQVLRRAGGVDGAGVSFGTGDASAPVFRLANLADVSWDEIEGNEQRLIAGEDAALSFDAGAEQASQPRFRLPGAVLFREPDFAGDSMFMIHVGEAANFSQRIHSLAVLPGHRVRLYVETSSDPQVFAPTPILVTGCVTLPGPVMARAEVDRIDLTAELPPPQLAAWATLAAQTVDALWSSGRAVRYAVAFEYPDGRLLRSGWWTTVGQGATDAEGYVTVDQFACPMLSGISRDPTGKAVARRVYRQVRGEPEVQVARIDNNVDTTWTEPVYSLVKPPPPAFKTWIATVPVAGSPVWRPGFGVRYAVEFEYADGAVARSGWWQAERQIAGDGYSYHDYAFPLMTLPVDPIGQIVARRVVRQFAGLPERIVARIADNSAVEWTDRDLGTGELPTPPPVFKIFVANLPIAGSPVWQPGFGVRYAVEFEYVDGTVVRSGWWLAERQVAGDGYSFHDYALAHMTLPVDPTGQIVARRVIRQFKGRPERMLARIANNTDTEWTDRDRGSADVPPPAPALIFFVANLPLAGSPVWRSGYGVRYAVEFEYEGGATVRSPWWQAQTQDANGYSFHWFALPRMTLPRDPTGEAVARRVIRQFIDLPERVLARITNNTDTEWTDYDRGLADKPLPPLTVNVWSASLPVASSPVWQPGCRVRYAVEFEYTDGTVLRTDWWRTAEPQDGDGYSAPGYAMPQLKLPCDPTGMVASRRVIRQFTGLPERIVAHIANNTDTLWTDTDRGTADNLPAPPTTSSWSANLPVHGSPTWQPGFRVRYAVAFEYADGTVVRSGWWRTAEPQDGEGYVASDYAMPLLSVAVDRSGQVVARRVIRQFLGQRERVIARLTNNGESSWCDRDVGVADLPPPPAPTVNCWSRNLPIAGSPVWQFDFRVRYAVAFEYADGTVVRSDGWRTAEPQDGEGYATTGYAMPVLNMPADPSGYVVARQVIRQFLGQPERVVGRITNNTDPTWTDTDAGFADLPPRPGLVCWAANLPVAGSPLWQPGFAVRYAIVYEFADGTTTRSAWANDQDGYLSSDGYAIPVLSTPLDPSGRVVARRVIRQCRGRPEREIGRIANNTDPTWADSDLGFADLPPPTTMSGLYAAQRESMEAFFVHPDGRLGFKYQVAPGLDLQSFRSAGRITGGVAAVFARQREHAEVFAVGEGRLHYFYVGPGWMCDANTFRPAEPITGPIAAVFGEARNHSEVFVVGSDGLLQRFHLDGGWQHEREPFRVAGRIKGLAVAYSRARDHAEVYAIDEAGTLHFFHREGGTWQHSVVPGVKVDGAISAVYSPRRGHTEAFFRGADGRLHFVYAENSEWKHEHAAFAGMGAVTGALAATFAQQRQASEVFLRGEDGRLRYVYCHEGVWMVDVNTFAPGGAVAGGVAAIFNPRHNHSEVMFVGADGSVHHFSIPGPQGWVHEVAGL
jgi:hypothetical protein